MSLSNIRNLAYSILKKLGDDNVKDAEFTEHEKCPQCDKDILSPSFEAFTVLSCGHAFHRECIEKTFLLTCQNNCPVTDCTATVKSMISERRFSVASSQSSASSLVRRMSNQLQVNSPVIHEDAEQEMDVDEVDVVPKSPVRPNVNSRKRLNEVADKKSKKHVRLKDSNTLKKLIRELSSDTTRISEIKEKKGLHRESEREVDGTRTFFDLYYKITKAEERNESAHHDLISSYYFLGEELEKRLVHFALFGRSRGAREFSEEHEALKKLYNEVQDQLPKEVTRGALRKKANRARKVYDLFFRIGDDKSQRASYIRRIKTFSATSIAKLSEDEVKYVASKVREGHQA